MSATTRYRQLWGRIIELRTAGILSLSSLEQLTRMQEAARVQAGGDTTPEMVEQLENWIEAYRHSSDSDDVPLPDESQAPLPDDVAGADGLLAEVAS